MSYLVIDIETIPDQRPDALDKIKEGFTAKAPDLTKPKLIECLGLGTDGKYKTVQELKDMWLEEFGEQAKENQAKEKWLKTSFDGSAGEICCICVEGYGVSETFGGDTLHDESTILWQFWDYILRHFNGRCPTLVAHNAKFDLPFIYHRSVILGQKPAYGFKPHGRHGSDHFCTMEAWSGFGGRIGLDRLAKALGIQGKDGMSGGDVWPAYQAGEHEKISEYCADDARITHEVYKRLTFS